MRRPAAARARHAGGSWIITTVVHTIVNVVDYGMTIQEAVDAPRFHQQWLPEATTVEPFAISPDTRRILEGMGHKLVPIRPLNQAAAILVSAPRLGGDPVGGNRFYGAIDPRYHSGLALGYCASAARGSQPLSAFIMLSG